MTIRILKNSQTTLKKSRIRLFRPPKWPKMTPQNRQNKLTFEWIFQFSGSFINLSSWKYPQSRPFKVENNSQTLPKQLQKNFEKVEKRTFLTLKMVTITLPNVKSGLNIHRKCSILGVIYQPFELKIQSIMCLLKPKNNDQLLLEQLQKNKSTENDFFDPLNAQK